MICYIYKIVNNITKKCYVGQTTNIIERKKNHLSKLKLNKHINTKLQAAWNKYGKENFCFEFEQFDLTKEELNELEKQIIKKENSFKDGYNLTLGGDGGVTKDFKLNFEEFCFAYFGNSEFKGLINRTAKFLKCDSSTISAITSEKSYNEFRQEALKLPKERKEAYLIDFIKKLDLENKPPKPIRKRMDEEKILNFLSLITVYGRGAEAAFLRANGLSKGLGSQIKNGMSYVKEYNSFFKLSTKEVVERAEKCFQEDKIQDFSSFKINKK